MFQNLGVPELFIILLLGGFWLLPIAAIVWVFRTLAVLRRDQAELLRRVEYLIERMDGRVGAGWER